MQDGSMLKRDDFHEYNFMPTDGNIKIGDHLYLLLPMCQRLGWQEDIR